MTNRLSLRSYIEQLLPLLPIKHISQITGGHWQAITEIDKRRLQLVVPLGNWAELRQLVMDKFAIFLNWLFATTVALTYFFVHVWHFYQANVSGINPSTGLLMKNRHFDITGNAYGWKND